MSASNQDLPLEIDVRAVASLIENGEDFLLLDCRERVEFEIARLEGAALLPMSELQARVGELTESRPRHIVVHCHHGMRSQQVALWLRQQGFSRVQSMTGGIDAWSIEVDPRVPRY